MSERTKSHCWVCDDHGGLYMLRNVDGRLADQAANRNWTKVDSGFKSIYAGYEGLVCGIKNYALYIRRGVTCENPVGVEWSVYECDVLKLMPGKSCIVRKSSKGSLYVARLHGRHAEVLDWRSTPPLDDEWCVGKRDGNVTYHYVVDENDRLFSISSNGEVFCCELLQTGDLQWILITGPPPSLVKDSSLVGWVTSFWRTQGDGHMRDWVGVVSSGVGSVWCLREGSKQVWQLVIGQLNDELKVNWVKTDLLESSDSSEEEITAMSACKAAKNGLYLIVRDEGHYRIVSCSLSAEAGCDRIDIKLPVRYPCHSMAVTSTTKTTKIMSQQVSPRKRTISEQSNAPMPKRVKDVDERTFVLNEIDVVFDLTNKFSLDHSIFLSLEDINAKFQYDFSLENSLLQ